MMGLEKLHRKLQNEKSVCLIAGVAEFICSNQLEAPLKRNQKVIGLNNFAVGNRHNLDQMQGLVAAEQLARLDFVDGNVRNFDNCRKACTGVKFVLLPSLFSLDL